jgi:hypothetical protein
MKKMPSKEIKILPVIPSPMDATSYYRGQLPLADLFHSKELGLIAVGEVSWSSMALADVLFLQRPFQPATHVIMAEVAQKLGKGVWCDWDDDLFTVTEDNPAHGTYAGEETKLAVAKLAAMADVVSVSTPDLAKRFNEIRTRAGKSNCVVIPNALADHLLLKRIPRDPNARRKLVFWRGSPSHQWDLMTVTDPLIQLLNKHQDWSSHFLGYNPSWLTRFLSKKNCIVGPGIDILDYHAYFGTIQPGVTIVPLANNEFNKSKSNIAWIEATYSHSQVVAPDFPEWRRPGILNYKDPADFSRKLRTAMDMVEANDWSMVDQSWDYIKENLLLSKVNEKRWDLLEWLCPQKTMGENDEKYHEAFANRFDDGYIAEFGAWCNSPENQR